MIVPGAGTFKPYDINCSGLNICSILVEHLFKFDDVKIRIFFGLFCFFLNTDFWSYVIKEND